MASGLWTRCHQLEYKGRASPEQTFEGLQDARVAMRSDLEKRAQAHSDPCRVRIEECLKTTPEGSERLDRRREVLNEALAKEDERIVRRRREEVGNTVGALAAPREKAATVAASSGSPQMESSRAVADESRMDVEGGEREDFRSSNAQSIRRRIMTKASIEE